jgi:outer membrane protein TolC
LAVKKPLVAIPATFKAARCAFIVLLFTGTAHAASAPPLTFEAAIQKAMTDSPEAGARQSQVEAARSSAIPAGALPDPKLFMGLDNYPVTGPNRGSFRDEMTMLTAGVMQEFPNAGKRRARVARAQAEIGVASAELTAHHRELALAAALAWLDLFYAQRRVAALDGVEAENRVLATTLAPRIASGSATAAESVAPKLQDAELADRRASVRADLAKARAELRRWIGPDADGPVAKEAPQLAIDPAALRQGLDTHPALRVYEQALARADADIREAEAAKRPDIGLEGAIHQRDPQYGWMVSARVTIDLPLFSSTRKDPLIAAKGAEANRMRLERDGVHRRLEAQLDSGLADYETAKEEAERARATRLPLLRQKVELQTASYRAGTSAFDALLAARRERVESELTALEREAAAAKAAARLAVYFGKEAP